MYSHIKYPVLNTMKLHSSWLYSRKYTCNDSIVSLICQLTMTDEVPGLEEGGPELTQHSGLTVSRLGEGGGGGGMDVPPRESPHLRSGHVTHTKCTCILHFSALLNWCIYSYDWVSRSEPS